MDKMSLEVVPYKETETSTLSKLFINGEFFCYTLEDGHNEPKIRGETRIPEGRYRVTRRFVGKFAENYKRRFNHLSSLWIREVPGFEYILIHTGNTVLHTAGCLLVGSRYKLTGEEYRIYNSTKTYRKLYTRISDHFKKGGEVEITVRRYE